MAFTDFYRTHMPPTLPPPPAGVRVDPSPVAPLPKSFVASIFVDFDAATDGDGSQESPRNSFPTGAEVVAGTAVFLRGTCLTQPTYLTLTKGGAEGDPVYYIADSAWGKLTVEAARDLTTAPCTDQPDAYGNENWAFLVKGVLPDSHAPDDHWQTLCYGEERRGARMSIYPSQDDDNWLNHTNLIRFESLLDVFWYPGINEADPQFDPDQSIGRYFIGEKPDDPPELAAHRAFLAASVVTGQSPVWLQYIYPQVWRMAPCIRVDDAGEPDWEGDWLIPDWGRPWGSAHPLGPVEPYTYARFGIMNLTGAVDRPGRYALLLNDADPALLAWPDSPGALVGRTTGYGGIRCDAQHVWWHGGRFQGFGSRNMPAGSYNLLDSFRINASNVRFEHATFGPNFSLDSTNDAYGVGIDSGLTKVTVRRNTFEGSVRTRAILFGVNTDFLIEQNLLLDFAGTGIGQLGDGLSVRLTVRNNLIYGKPDLHGNSLTFYGSYHQARITGNVSIGSGRPFVMQAGLESGPPEAGPIYTYIAGNSSICSDQFQNFGYGMRLTGRVKNAIVEHNVFGSLGNQAFSSSASNLPDADVNRCLFLGDSFLGFATTARTIYERGEGNTAFSTLTEPGATMLANALKARPAVTVGAAA